MTDQQGPFRSTGTVCDICLVEVPGVLRLEGSHVFLVRHCPKHGERRWLVSRNGERYVAYDQHFHGLFHGKTPTDPTGEPIFCLTNRCNQGCGYCLTESNKIEQFEDFNLDCFRREVRSSRDSKICLFGGEPLMHPRFFDFVEAVASAGKTALVCTNGIAFADEEVVRRLVSRSRGRCFVRMTFEGFLEEDYEHLRIPGLRDKKLAALANLESHGVPLLLAHTVTTAEQQNPERFQGILERVIEHANNGKEIRGLSFSCMTALGGESGRDPGLVPSVDTLMDAIVASRSVPTARNHVYTSQHLIHWLFHVLDESVCEYKQAVVLFRTGKGWVGVDEFLDCDSLQARLDRRLARGHQNRVRRALGLAYDLLASVRWAEFPAMARIAMKLLPFFLSGRDYRRLPDVIFVVTAGTACDPNNFDETVASHCDKVFYSQLGNELSIESSSVFLFRNQRNRAAREP